MYDAFDSRIGAETNGLRERQKTLGDMLTLLRDRLGFVSQGPASRNNETILKSFLQDAVDYVWGQTIHPETKRIARIKLAPGSVLYDWHDDAKDIDIDPDYVLRLEIADGTSRYELTRGITEEDRAMGETGRPERWDHLNGQIELYPAPDSEDYRLVLTYIDTAYRFERLDDRCPVPWRLAFLYALANSKAHYHQQDAQAVGSAFQTALKEYRGRQVNGLSFSAFEGEPEGRWYVSRGADGVFRGSFR